ncbi:hypothetical protein [Nostoc sp. UHCC 0252]|uniref:hypothetical protein n=1 Tax=Nostoc sp. UHCC 0252 TaxID=3110241 RepID=UPI002B21D594|nr:hypothetical protein [Nostoc sp. UHCC 0252]MEA5604671.1 hypothetical protein [Nostoc sp. UHCC 0252]
MARILIHLKGVSVIKRSLLIPLHEHPIYDRNPPLWKLHQQLLDHNLQSRIIIPALLQEAKPRILARIPRHFEFLHTLRSQPHVTIFQAVTIQNQL